MSENNAEYSIPEIKITVRFKEKVKNGFCISIFYIFTLFCIGAGINEGIGVLLAGIALGIFSVLFTYGIRLNNSWRFVNDEGLPNILIEYKLQRELGRINLNDIRKITFVGDYSTIEDTSNNGNNVYIFLEDSMYHTMKVKLGGMKGYESFLDVIGHKLEEGVEYEITEQVDESNPDVKELAADITTQSASWNEFVYRNSIFHKKEDK